VGVGADAVVVVRRSFKTTAVTAVTLKSPSARKEVINCMLECLDAVSTPTFRVVFMLRLRGRL
jgi:hypothetical protein